MRKRLITLALLLCLSAAGPAVVWAAESSSQQLVDEYVEALRSGDQSLVDKIWLRIYDDKQTLAYMEEKDPKKFKSFKLWGISRDFRNLKK